MILQPQFFTGLSLKEALREKKGRNAHATVEERAINSITGNFLCEQNTPTHAVGSLMQK